MVSALRRNSVATVVAVGVVLFAFPASADVSALSILAERTPLWGHSISPDGKHAIVRRLLGNSRQIDVINLSTGEFAELHGQEYRFASWRPDSLGIYAIKNPNLYSIDIWPFSEPQKITPSGLGRWRVVGYPRRPNSPLIVATLTRSSAPFQNLYECPNVAAISDGCIQVSSDFPATGILVRGIDGRVKLKMTHARNGRVVWLRRSEMGRWKEVFGHAPDRTFQPVGILGEDGWFFAISSRFHNFPRLVRVNSETGKENSVLSFVDRGIAAVTMSTAGARPLIATSVEIDQKRHFLDPSLEPVFLTLTKRFNREVWLRVLSVDQSDRLFTVSVQSPDTVESIFLLDASSNTVKQLTQRSYAEYTDQFGAASTRRIQTRDGQSISAIAFIPRGFQRFPLVVRLHGGPWDRYYPVFDRTSQYLSGNGYAVLNLNYHGSSGFGIEFQEMTVGRLLETIQANVEDAVRWAGRELPIDLDRLAVMGFSFGGYMALRNAMSDQSIFKAAVSNSGIVDLEEFWTRQQTVPVSKYMWSKYLGLGERFSNQGKLRRYLATNSPAQNPEKISIPILVVAGEKDQRVSAADTKRFALKANEKRKTVESMYFVREGHGIRGTRNLVDWHERMLKFLNDHL